MQIEVFHLEERDWVPNNGRLPVIVYRQAVDAGSCENIAAAFEGAFAHNGWPAQWRGGIYEYDRYHSTAHEVLGVASGSAQLVIGGPGGREIEVTAGDAVLLPAGTGHRCLAAAEEFLVVGGYPGGQKWDICPDAPSDEARARMVTLAFPPCDPVWGTSGPLVDHWR
ncbi:MULTISPECIES: cupin domain-containing protein [unclassified Novosphingobium]|uniref:cupin domain-containing protein n=1 Tax=unclassified Novosphingobium TaxID=2644732 RepID=UPI00135AED73|nr:MULTISPECIES: cupin domain-containing protein [unclassified Novosphingobium]